MFTELNGFFRYYQHLMEGLVAIATIVAAIGTWAAVVVSLWIALASRTSKVSAFVELVKLMPSSGKEARISFVDAEESITVSIANKGPYTVYVPYWSGFFWKIPFAKIAVMQNPLTDYRRQNNIELLAGKSENIQLSTVDNLREIIQKSQTSFYRYFKKTRTKHMYLEVRLSDGRKIKAIVGSTLRQRIKDIVSGKV